MTLSAISRSGFSAPKCTAATTLVCSNTAPVASAPRAVSPQALAPTQQALRTPQSVSARWSGARLLCIAGGAMACLAGSAQAYPCTGRGTVNQFFVNGDQSLYGVIHGWLADCYDQTYVCGSSCSGGSISVCTPVYCTDTEVDETPSQYVSQAAGRVAACGFELTSGIPGNASVRIANALIERNLRVKISVNALNLTDVTDPSVMCLHAID